MFSSLHTLQNDSFKPVNIPSTSPIVFIILAFPLLRKSIQYPKIVEREVPWLRVESSVRGPLTPGQAHHKWVT